jgi:hypothetical protein
MAETRTASGEPSKDLEAERDRLRRRVEELEARPQRRRRVRRVAAALFVVLSIVAFAAAVPAAWARRTVLETDRYVAVVAPLPEDPAVREYLSRTITTSIFDALSVEERLREALSERAPRLTFLAGPLANGVRGFVQDRVEGIVSSEGFATYWADANRFVHEQLVLALEGEGSVVVTDGKVVLNLLPIVNEAFRSISGTVSELIGRDITLPEVTGDQVPAEAITRLETALDVDLPERFGTVVVYDGNEIAAVQRAINAFARGVVLAVLAFLLFGGLALWLSPSKRRTLVQLTTAALVVLVVERRLAIVAADRIVGQARDENREAARAVVDQVLGSLLEYTGWLALILASVLLIALLTGPYGWALRLRAWTRDLGATASGAVREGPSPAVAAWTSAHRDALMLGVAGLLVAILLLVDLSIGGLVVVIALGVALELLIHRIAAAVRGGAALSATGSTS